MRKIKLKRRQMLGAYKTRSTTREVGLYATVDDFWYMFLTFREWLYHPQGYAYRIENGKFIFMHKVVAEADHTYEVRFIDKDKLNVQESNLKKMKRKRYRNGEQEVSGTAGKDGGVTHSQEQRLCRVREPRPLGKLPNGRGVWSIAFLGVLGQNE